LIKPREAAVAGLRDLGHEFCTYGNIKHEIYGLLLRKITELGYCWFSKRSLNKANQVLARKMKTN